MKSRLGMTILVAAAASLYIPLNRTLTGWFNLGRPEKDDRLFRSFISAGLFIMLSAALFFYVFPTYVQQPPR